MNKTKLSINDEFSTLKQVIIGLGAPYQRDKERVAAEMQEFPLIPKTERKSAVLALEYPTEALLIDEYISFVAALEKYGVQVLRPDPKAAYSFEYTCPRDIGFVIGDTFFIASMAVHSRDAEYKTILQHFEAIDGEKIVQVPHDGLLEGGDVILLDEQTVLVGMNTRSNQIGMEFLKQALAPQGIHVYPVPHKQLHLDCCLNPLGKGHMLIHRDSLDLDSEEIWKLLKRYEWIEVDAVEREHLATNVLSINAETIIARQGEACARVNDALRDYGYTIEEVQFDGVPATGGSFRCASLVMQRGE